MSNFYTICYMIFVLYIVFKWNEMEKNSYNIFKKNLQNIHKKYYNKYKWRCKYINISTCKYITDLYRDQWSTSIEYRFISNYITHWRFISKHIFPSRTAVLLLKEKFLRWESYLRKIEFIFQVYKLFIIMIMNKCRIYAYFCLTK